jgi:hypothetical protein
VTTVNTEQGAQFTETLHVPLRWWVQATMFVATIWLAFVVALPAMVAWGATAAVVLVVTGLFLGYGAARVRIEDGLFHAGKAKIPVSLLSDPMALDPEATRRLAGVDANARAFLLLRPYLKHAVKVTVDDPDDPVPYWLVSTRHPDSLASALAAASGGMQRD